MKIRFNTRKSGFYDKIKSALDDSSLDREVTVLSSDGYSYAEEEIKVLILETDTSNFS